MPTELTLMQKALQLGLFDTVIHVPASVRSDGTTVDPYTRVQKVRAKAKPTPKPSEHAPTPDLLGLVTAPATKPTAVAAATASVAPPAPARQRAEPFGVPAGISKTARREINARVRALLDESKTMYSTAERALLRQYSGNGGCGDSLNEFYTDLEVAAAMWSVLGCLGVDKGDVLEPSCGAGVFLHAAPAGVNVVGVEIDSTSARVAAALFGPDITESSLERFVTQHNGERQFSAVIGNVPFGLRGATLRDDKPNLSDCESYFLDTALDVAAPGGVVALIVPTGVMDASTKVALRMRALCKGQFLGAMRMPNTAFEHSHTAVTTDIVLFRKRGDEVAAALRKMEPDELRRLGAWDSEFLSGEYFSGRGAGNVFGSTEAGWRSRAGMGTDITVSGSMLGVPQAIAEFVPEDGGAAPTMSDIMALLHDDDERAAQVRAAADRRPYTWKPGDTKTLDGVTYILQGRPPRWHRVDEFMQTAAVTDAQAIAADIDALMRGDAVDRAGLEERVSAWVDAHGIPAANPNLQLAARQDRTLYRLIGAVDPKGRVSDVVTGAQHINEGAFAASAATMALQDGSFAALELARQLGTDIDEVEDQLHASPDQYARLPDGRWTTMDVYLTGNLWEKLDALRAAPADGPDKALFQRQAAKLEEAIAARSLEDVDVTLASGFFDPSVIAAWWNARNQADGGYYSKQTPLEVKFVGGIYTFVGGKDPDYGRQDSRISMLSKYLNRDGLRRDDAPTIAEWNEQFKDWLLGSSLREAVEDAYNRKFRGFVAPAYSDAPIPIAGLTEVRSPNGYQWSMLRRNLAEGRGIVAADVGVGKTLQGLLIARAAMLNGSAKRPWIVVPKSVLANWATEAEMWFPGAKVLTIGATLWRDADGQIQGRDDDAAERRRKLHDSTQNAYDFIIVGEPTFQEIDLSPDLKDKLASEDMWVQRAEQLRGAKPKKVARIREQHEQQVAARDFQKRTDAIWFDELGVDLLIRDEAHREKNLFAARPRFGETIKFLGGQGQSDRAYDFYLKSKWLRAENDGKGVFLLTATPTKNSPLEIYSMLSHVAPEEFLRLGIRNADDFIDRYCEQTTENIYDFSTGGFSQALCATGFKNLTEIRALMDRWIDRRTAADVGLKLPSRHDEMHVIDMSTAQRDVYVALRERLKSASGEDKAKGSSHVFAIMSDMAKAATDLELYDPVAHGGVRSAKIEAAADQAVKLAEDGGQILFSDYIAAHEKLARALEARGVPRSQIGIMNAQAAGSAAKRQKISEAFNAGKLKYVIGNTATMGEGTNLQRQTTDIHNLDFPWDPASMQQRIGRGLRQGNTREAVRVHNYMTKGSFDGYRLQSMLRKKDWQDLLWSGEDRIENLARDNVISPADLMVMCADDPEKAAADIANDKDLAQQKFTAAQTADAVTAFKRLRRMMTSRALLPNNKAAARLDAQIERSRSGLAANPNFHAKDALKTGAPVVLHPETGKPVAVNDSFTRNAHQYVVTRVTPASSSFHAREWGVGGSERELTDEELRGTQPAVFDPDAEVEHIRKREAVAAEAHAQSVKTPMDLKGLPDKAIEENAPELQEKIKGALRAYAWHLTPAHVGFLNAAQQPVLAPGYNARKLAENHDLILPTSANRERVMQALIGMEREGKQFGYDHVQRRRGGTHDQVFGGAKYNGEGVRYGTKTNPWAEVGKDLWGTEFVTEASERRDREQFDAASAASSTTDALRHLLVTVEVPRYVGSHPKWPARALEIAFDKARVQGDLATPMKSVMPKYPTQYGGISVPAEVVGGATNEPVGSALAQLAEKAGRPDLAARILAESDHEAPRMRLRRILQMPVSAATRAVARELAEQHGFLDETLRGLGVSASYSAGDARFPYSRIDTPLRQLLEPMSE